MNNVKPLDLLSRCESGETGAIEEFVRTYQPMIFRLALSILDDPVEAEEAAQDALVIILNKLSSFRGEAAFTTWLYTLTLNHCRQRLRKRRSRERLIRLLQDIIHLHSETRQLETEVQQGEANAILWTAIRRLSNQQKEAIILRYYHNLPIASIAAITGVSERTVHNRLAAAHDHLRVQLKEKDTP